MSDATTHTSYKLMRARHGRMLGGVAAGLAKASGLDVTVVRVCLGAMVLTFGLGVPAYILMWVVLPEESPRRGRMIEPAPEQTARIMRMAIVGIAALSVLNQLGGFAPFSGPRAENFGWGGVFGLVLLGIGATVLFSRHRPDGAWLQSPPPPNPAPTTSWRPPAPAGDDADVYVGDDEGDEPPTYVGPFRDVMAPVADAVSDALREVRTTLVESRPRRGPASTASADPGAGYYDDDLDDLDDDYYGDEPDDPPRVARVTVSGLSNSGGAALGFARVVGWLSIIWFTLAAIAVTGAWLFGALTLTKPVVLLGVTWLVFVAVLNTLLHAKFPRAIIPTLALLLIPIAIGGATIRPNGDLGHRVIDTFEQQNYRQAIGRLDLNFGDDEFSEDTTINARVGVGAIFVEVPDDVALTVKTRTGAGGYEVLGRGSDDPRGRRTLTFEGCPDAPRLTLNLRTGAGFVQVHRDSGKAAPTCNAA